MRELFVNQSYKLKLKEGWESNIDGNLTTIYNKKDAVGALHISSYFLNSSVFNQISYEEELKDFIVSSLPELEKIDLVSNILSKENGAYYTILTDESFWFFEIKGGNDKVLLISYNCEKPYSKKELGEVNKIIDSVELV